MPGTFSPPPWVSDPDRYHGTCVVHVQWRMPGPLTSGFLNLWRVNVPRIPGACATRNFTYQIRSPWWARRIRKYRRCNILWLLIMMINWYHSDCYCCSRCHFSHYYWYHHHHYYHHYLRLMTVNLAFQCKNTKGHLMRTFYVNFFVSLKKVLKRQLICRWSETIWRSCDVIVMWEHWERNCGQKGFY